MEPRPLLDLIAQAAAEQWEELDLCGYQLTELPPEIGRLTQLKRLILGQRNQETQQCIGVGLRSLPPEIALLTNLTDLILSGNHLTEIPDCVTQLSSLEILHVNRNQLTEIPPSIVNLTHLKKLYLWGNQLCQIPECIGQLTHLVKLDFGGNQITEIPICTAQLSNLTELYLLRNQIRKISEHITQLNKLTKLQLNHNQICEIPECVTQIPNLTELFLRGNQIKKIPEYIKKSSSLKELYLAQNQINEIPESLISLPNLTRLSLWGNQIETIPEYISQLKSLTELYLDKNQIYEIPKCVFQLTHLTHLYLHQNQIREIPKEILKLTNLTHLSLWGNQICEMPDYVAQLTNLTMLDLGSNQINQIPECISQLTNLTYLSFAGNQIQEMPECIGQLTNLIELHLWGNQIREIPDYIDQLTNLKLLRLERNAIRQLPRTLAQLQQLDVLHLEKNPLPIPSETLWLGWGKKLWEPGNPQAILDYYFTTRDPEQTQTLYEVKLLLVGEGGAGKTSLAHKLLDPNYELPPETEATSTQGIDILKWEFTGRNGHPYCLSIWDFGGQEIYHQTHQFFLTERALYLLVADSRKQDTDHYYWLQSIQLLSNHSPVLLIQNEKQDRTCNLNLNQLRGEFANLRDTYRINLADNRGLSELQTAIQHELERLIPQGIPFPNKWLAVRYALQNDGRNYIDYSEYETTCRRHGIARREEMASLSRFLHELGICLHFQADPILCHRLILKPNWGTAAVYKILDNETVKQNLGQFCDADLANIWAAPEYADMRHALLQLMKEFKVCYEIPRRKGHYIAPHLLSAAAPSYDWPRSPNLMLRYRYPGFMPKGILTRFIVEMHREIENVSDPDRALVWRTGVVLCDLAARAQIIEHYHQREIVIRVSGNRPRDLLTIINRKFQEIHDSFDDRLAYDTLIPCNCTTCKTTCKPGQQPFTFPLDRLHQCLDQGRPTIECHESGEDVSVRGLIDNVILELPDDPDQFEMGDPEFVLNREMGKIYHRGNSRRRYGPRSSPSSGLRSQPTNLPPANLSPNHLPPANLSPTNLTVSITNRYQPEQTMSNDKIWQGDRMDGDKVMGNKISDNQIAGNQLNTGTVQGDAIAGNKIIHSQNLAQAAQDIKALLDQLAIDYPNEDEFTRAGRAVGAIKNNPTLKQRVTQALKESGTTAVEKAIEGVTNNPAVSIIVAGVKGFLDVEG